MGNYFSNEQYYTVDPPYNDNYPYVNKNQSLA